MNNLFTKLEVYLEWLLIILILTRPNYYHYTFGGFVLGYYLSRYIRSYEPINLYHPDETVNDTDT